MEILTSALPSFSHRKTSALIDWDRLDALTVGFTDRGTRAASAPEESSIASEEKRRQLATLFEAFQNQCGSALKELRRSTRICVGVIALAAVASVAGSAVLAFIHAQKLLGGALSVGGLGTLVAVLARALALARDEAMLQLLPTRYQLAFALAATPKQYEAAYRAFLAETSSLRAGRR
jgi:hypothetical protein